MKKLIWIIIMIAAAIGLTFVLAPQQQGTSTVQETSQEGQEPVARENYLKYYGENDKTVFEVLKEVTQVEYKEYDFGVFVESIGGVRPDSQHFWKLYLNGEEAQVGAGELKTRDTDIIEWKIEEIGGN